MYRSDGKIIAGNVEYTYRAWSGTNPVRREPGEREGARGASMADAIAALVRAADRPHQPGGRRRSTGAQAPGLRCLPADRPSRDRSAAFGRLVQLRQLAGRDRVRQGPGGCQGCRASQRQAVRRPSTERGKTLFCVGVTPDGVLFWRD
jgi:hypothetical protein